MQVPSLSAGPLLSVSECVIPETPNLTDLPNEILVKVLCYLDSRTKLFMRMLCRRLHALTSDPVSWSAISWRADNRLKDVNGLKLALRLSKSVLKSAALFCPGGFHLSQCIDRILSCRQLQSISLRNVVHTEKQIIKLLASLPGLTYLHLDNVDSCRIPSIAKNGRQLKTLSINNVYMYRSLLVTWADAGYMPPDFRIASHHKWCSLEYASIFFLPPSPSHNAYLSIYHFATEEIVPSHPYLQIHFTPKPTMPILKSALSQGLPAVTLALTADAPDSNIFTTASCTSFYASKTHDVDMGHIRDSLTLLKLQRYACGVLGAFGTLPNLVHLDVSGYDILSDLDIFAALSSSCPKLKVLNLLHSVDAESLEKLWRILATMANLRVLSVPMFLVMERADPIPMPALRAIMIDGVTDTSPRWNNVDLVLDFIAQMPSLEVVKFEHVPKAPVNFGLTSLLHASNLTHLYISKAAGNKLTLPADPLCYATLEQFYLSCSDFVFREDLANAIAHCKKLHLLVLEIHWVDIKGVTNIVDLSKSLSVFCLTLSSNQFGSRKKSELFAKSLRKKAMDEGRKLNFKIGSIGQRSNDLVPSSLLNWFH